jgi:hypothetical protein
MPAVELTRIKKQAEELAGCFSQPADFRLMLVDRLEFYADRVTRQGNMVKPVPLIPRYGVPALFLQAVEYAMQKQAAESPLDALALAEELWKESYLEPKLLSASLIGMAAKKEPQVSAAYLVRYCVPQENSLVQEALLQRSGVQLREANLQVWFDLVERWVNSETLSQQLIGFRALQGVIEDRDFENLPVIFRLLTIPIETTNRSTLHELQILITAIARRSAVETVYFLRQCYNRSENPMLARLIRKCLPEFAADLQSSLRRVIQDRPERPER